MARVTEVSTQDLQPGVVLDASGGGSLALPDGFPIADADFVRSGPDLMIIAPDGEAIAARGFFDAETPADLTVGTTYGLSGALVARLAGPAAPGQVAQAATALPQDPIGQVDSVDGAVTATRVDGTQIVLQVGDPVFQGDVLQSANNGAVAVLLADETLFAMAGDSRMVLDEMVYDPGAGDGSIAFSAVKGVFTFISGQVAKSDPDAMVIDTPLASIGIRGTQTGLSLPSGEDLTVVLMKEGNGFVGEIVVNTADTSVVINLENFATIVSATSGELVEPFEMTVDQIVEVFSTVLGRLPSDDSRVNDYGAGTDRADADLFDFEPAAGADEESVVTITYSRDYTRDGTDTPPPVDPPATDGQEDRNGDADGSGGPDDDDNDEEVEALGVFETTPAGGGSGGDVIIPDNTIFGTEDADTLIGTPGTDVILGFGEGDVLISAGGADTLTGGEGGDIFRYTLSELATEGGDTITDFVTDSDTIDVFSLLFGTTTQFLTSISTTFSSGTTYYGSSPSGNFTAITLTGTQTIEDFIPPQVGNPVFVYENRDDALYVTEDGGASYQTVASFEGDPSLSATDIRIVVT